MENQEREVKILALPNGDKPYSEWFASLRDSEARIRIRARVNRARAGNFGDHKFFSGGVGELRIDHGPGYRVYFAVYQGAVIILIGGGNKTTQDEDIAAAMNLWEQYKIESKNDAS